MNSIVRPNWSFMILQQVEDLRLHGDVERGDGLVADQQPGLRDERPRDADPLGLPARERAGPPIADARRRRGRPRRGPPSTRLSISRRPCFHTRSGAATMSLDLAARVERRDRVLQDDLHRGTELPQLPLGQADELVSVVHDRPRCRRRQLEHRPARRRLPAAGLAHEAERLPGGDVEAHVGDGVDPTVMIERVLDRQVLDTQDERVGSCPQLGGPATGQRSPPRSLSASRLPLNGYQHA